MKLNLRNAMFAAATMLMVGFTLPAPASAASTLSSVMFQDSTGIQASDADIQAAWSKLQAMGTTSYLGGTIGTFKLDESSLIAGALTIGVTEFDNFLKTGSLSSISSTLGSLLSTNMTSAAGINLSSLVGSFTSGGGNTVAGIFDATASNALGTGGQCSPTVATDLTNVGKKHVDMMRTAALSDDVGVTPIGSLNSASGAGTGFASMSCLDKLFQNAGSDILFKPPSLSNLIGQLQNWTCPKAVSVATQVMGGFGDLSNFATESMGGFYPAQAYGEANDGSVSPQPGIGNDVKKVFGSTFGTVSVASGTQISSMTGLTRLFQ